MKLRSLVVAGASVTALAVAAPSALAADTQIVSGVGGTSLSINVATPVVFSTLFSPGGDFTGAGTVTALSTSPSWTLSIKDATDNGHLKAANGVDLTGLGGGLTLPQGVTTSTCTNSASQLAAAPGVQASGTLPGGVSTPAVAGLSNTDQTIASATAAVLPLNTLTTTFSQHVGSAEQLQSGCLYRVTSTYTLG